MNSRQPLLLIQDLEKSYKGHGKVLDGISFQLYPNEVKVLIGSSGGGKSTLLQCINLLTPYDRGKIYLDGVLIRPKNKNICRQDIGFVFQHFNLFAHLTALDNVTLGPTTVKGVPRKQARGHAEELLEKVGLKDKMFNYPAELSGGQKQRLGIARALGMKPKLILFDEPTSALDPELIGEVLRIMKDLAKEGMTMLVVTHEMGFAQAVSNEIIFIEKGKIIEQGPPEQFSDPVHERTRQFLHKIEEQ
ncbi:MAG: amino acid ABC transporter ATP-binding protein [Desulfovermiculus sp.]|nr:amino acid ABC transporter ATP-binding protein [Desulfovermiculus sp.]